MTRSKIFLGLSAASFILAACAGPSPAPSAAPASPVAETAAPSEAPARAETTEVLAGLGGEPCPRSDFTCVTLLLPLDHFDPANEATIEVVIAVLPASGERRGTFVTAVGGPGGSGLAVADPYTAAFDPSLTASFDIVFFDQRGVAASGGLQCVEAATAFYRSEWDATTPEGEADLLGAARRFADDCVAETGRDDLLPFLGTEQAVEDLDAFRAAFGDEQIWLYGESYGTQFAQTYAAVHPDRVAALVLDGPVDLTLSGLDYYAEQAQAFDDVLRMTLEACADDPVCPEDLGGDPQAAYDDLAARLALSPITSQFPLPSGENQPRDLTLADLQTAAASYLYSETSRMIFLRALGAAATREDVVPLTRLLYDSLAIDPETLLPIPDPTYSDAVYYAVECNDYDFGLADDYLHAGDAVDASVPRLASIFYGDLPCAFWPEDGLDAGRPAPLTAEGIPTLVLVGTADPATPPANARRIASRLADGYLVVEEGGPHVIFGWGNECVDGLVTSFLVKGRTPDERETTCDGVVIADYVPLAPADAAAFETPLEALLSLDTEIYYLPEYYYWDLESPRGVGCPYGGSLHFEPSDVGETLAFDACAFSDGFVVTGSGAYDYDADRFEMSLSVTGAAEGQLDYTREGDGSISVRGEYDGKPVDLGA
jgi:pimeloyl-ACP methyl ester carboxylesterase